MMGRIRNILKGIKIETSVGTRRCHRSAKHSIQPGERHLAVYSGAARENFCLACADPMLEVAAKHLDEVRRNLAQEGARE